MHNFNHVLQLSRTQIQILSLVNEKDLLVEIWQRNIKNNFIMDFRISGKNGIVCIAAFHINPQYVAKMLPYYEISLRRPKVYICDCDLPGFFLERDRFHNAKFTEMLRYKVVFDKMTMNISELLGVSATYEDGTFFPVKHEIEISPAFYTIPLDADIKSSIQIASLSRTSVILEHSIKHQSKIVLVMITKLVSVNHGRTVSIPDSFMSQEAVSPLVNRRVYSKVIVSFHKFRLDYLIFLLTK